MVPAFAFVVSLAVTMVLIPRLMGVAGRLHMLDLPNARKVHRDVIPRVGGIAMVVGAVLPIILWVPMGRQVVALLFGIGVILLFGFWDDRADLDYRWKFAGQLLATLLVVVGGDVTIQHIPFLDGDALPGYVTVPLTIVVVVGITNAINLADGLDGLAGGTTLLSLVGIALLAYQAGGVDVMLVSIAVIGAVLGFLRYNTYPARVFMGDTGSQFLGFSTGVLAIILTQYTNPALSAALPLLLLGLAILDTIAVMLQRIYEGRSPFAPDKNHIHHKLLALGFDHYEAVVLIYFAKAGLVFAAYLLRYESDILVMGSYLGFCFVVLALFRVAGTRGWRLRQAGRPATSGLAAVIRGVRESRVIRSFPDNLVSVAVPVLLVSGAIFADRVPADFAIGSGVLLVVALAAKIGGSERSDALLPVVAYVTCAFSVYLLESTGARWPGASAALNGYFLVLAVAVALAIRFSKHRSFEATPLDLLVILLALTVPNLPEVHFRGFSGGEFVLKLIVLFYACEVIRSRGHTGWRWLKAGVVTSLAVIAARGFL